MPCVVPCACTPETEFEQGDRCMIDTFPGEIIGTFVSQEEQKIKKYKKRKYESVESAGAALRKCNKPEKDSQGKENIAVAVW